MGHYSPILSSLLVLFLCIAPSAYSHIPNIKDICSTHKNPIFCEEFLKPKHGAALTCMTEYAIHIAKEKAAIAHSTLGTMVRTTPEIRLKQHYHACLEHYTDAIDNLNKVQTSYETKDFFGMNIAASALMTNVDDCETSEAPGYDPSLDLKRKNEEMEYASIILMILANQLGGRH